ncbi:pimeloyl-CoA dehydrogenase large subunit [Marinobacter halodurans]|uniref:Pimeloyl-CoA dehydrogenase large subunit n=1 Tax=Marinobacter halodurans TaxID=2528979 RepID=A0ABY1ZGY3_9GAMM|nr:acyl-CoA dehydrogenase family protein [Marinobacter halodurans]TBW51869.1 pimeloyl-CoA dehydrogenase large subunit [Marinobacter halodurans]
MNMNYTADELAFRDEVRTFLEEKLPADIAAKVKEGRRMSRADHERWQQILVKQGWYATHWPEEYGGVKWTAVQKHIWDEESCRYGAPRSIPFGVNMVAPVIIKFGSEEQKQHYLPRILSGEDWWCQGYSEPGSGSDLASLKTRAVREGDHYIVNGQKTWTTLGQHANMIFCLVRTNTEVKAQEGISFLLIDMKTPGVTVRPIITLDGEHEVNEVFFDDVKVPVENLVGDEDKGWTYAKYLLTYERTGLAGIGASKAALSHLKAIAGRQKKNGRPLIEDPTFAQRVAQVEIDLMAASISNLRIIASVEGGGVPGAESSMLKVRGTELRQAITDLSRRALGPYAQPFVEEELALEFEGDHLSDPDGAALSPQYFNMRKLSIFGGSNEIQKNIVTKMILGL